MIVGGTTTIRLSKKARKTYLKMVQNVLLTGFVLKIVWIDNPIIEFSKEDARHLHHPHDDARYPLWLVIILSKSLEMLHSLLLTTRPSIMPSSDDLLSTHGRS